VSGLEHATHACSNGGTFGAMVSKGAQLIFLRGEDATVMCSPLPSNTMQSTLSKITLTPDGHNKDRATKSIKSDGFKFQEGASIGIKRHNFTIKPTSKKARWIVTGDSGNHTPKADVTPHQQHQGSAR
jgi:hypothetical protein